MLPNNERANKFVEAITREAMEKKAEIENEINEFVTAEMKTAELAALGDSYNMIQKAGAAIHSDSAAQVSAAQAAGRKGLLSRRSEIADEVLEKVAEKIREFTKSGDYKAFLMKSAQNAKKIIGEDMTVYLRSADRDFGDEICTGNIEVDDEIILGGLHFSDKSGVRRIDDTLDKRLLQGHEWFMKNSGLTVK